MKRNLGELERILRVICGVFGMLLGFLFIQGVFGTILGTLGALSFLTGAVGWCGLYVLLGRRSLEPEPVEVLVDES